MGIDALKYAIDRQMLEQRVALMLRCNPRLSLASHNYGNCIGRIVGADYKRLSTLPLRHYGLQAVVQRVPREPYYDCLGKGVIVVRREDGD